MRTKDNPIVDPALKEWAEHVFLEVADVLAVFYMLCSICLVKLVGRLLKRHVNVL